MRPRPPAVASIDTAREKLLCRLRRTATHDGLTDALRRGTFLGQARRLTHRLFRRLIRCAGYAPACALIWAVIWSTTMPQPSWKPICS